MIRLPPRGVGWLFALTTLTSAFLLFQVQPLLSKYLLPWFGGTPAVWTTCVLFFQTALFIGYLYAHLSERVLSERIQAAVHIALLTAALVALPILPHTSWKPMAGEQPVTLILAVLSVSVGLPYLLLSSTGPLLSAWFARCFPGKSPYRLYALSNFGSLLALLTYPFLVEPTLSIRHQASGWSSAFAIFAACCAVSAIMAAQHPRPDASERLKVLLSKHERAQGTAQVRFKLARHGSACPRSLRSHSSPLPMSFARTSLSFPSCGLRPCRCICCRSSSRSITSAGTADKFIARCFYCCSRLARSTSWRWITGVSRIASSTSLCCILPRCSVSA